MFWPRPACRAALRLAAAAVITGGAVGAAEGTYGAMGTAEDIYGAEGVADDIKVEAGVTAAAVVVTVEVEKATVDEKKGAERLGAVETGVAPIKERELTWSCKRRICRS